MNTERTIHICGKDVAIRYCAATETGYETISGQSISVFIPDIEKDKKGKIIKVTSKATMQDFITLAVAGILAAYARRKEQEPITTDDIIYDATPDEVTELIKTISELRNEWYQVSKVVKKESEAPGDEPEGEGEKN